MLCCHPPMFMSMLFQLQLASAHYCALYVCLLALSLYLFSLKRQYSSCRRQYAKDKIISKFMLSSLFLPRDALVHSAVLRLHVVRLSVRLSVCLSVTLVDQDHIGWKSWKLIVRTLSPAPSLFVAERPST